MVWNHPTHLWSGSTAMASTVASAASMALFMAVWVPLIRATFMKPAAHPTRQPPGKVSPVGMLCRPPSFRARAPYLGERGGNKWAKILLLLL